MQVVYYMDLAHKTHFENMQVGVGGQSEVDDIRFVEVMWPLEFVLAASLPFPWLTPKPGDSGHRG